MTARTDQLTARNERALHQVRKFNATAARARVFASRFGDQTAVMHREVLEECERLVPALPYIGGRENAFASDLVAAAWALAVLRVVLRHGGDLADAGLILHRAVQAYWRRVPRPLRPVMRWYMFSSRGQRRMRAMASRSQARRYPADWVCEFVEGDHRTFDYGIDITECGIVKYLNAQGAPDLAPHLCSWDYVRAETLGYRLDRTRTLAWGCDRCDFRPSRRGAPHASWPPRVVERDCGRAANPPSPAPTPAP